MDRTLIVGLGNPGRRYEHNRHNVGFMVVDALAAAKGLSGWRSKFKGQMLTGELDGAPVALLKPETFMNLSGQAVQAARAFFGSPLERILVVHDELDLPYGTLRLKVGGGHAGHNGLRSLCGLLGGAGFVRLRVGIGRPRHGEVADYVLADFATGDERAWLPDLLDRAVVTILQTLREGPQLTMNTVNAS
jgi:PTH1 family peptidyl-tRNA hydrolase